MKAKRKAITPVVFCFLILLTLVDIGSPPFLAAQDIVVESANPPAAEQGTVNLDVEIKGKGFGRDSQAMFFVSGTTNPGGITVNSTTFKRPNLLIANITVAEGATISKFDIQVKSLSNGRIGKGIELFSVVQKGKGTDPFEATPLILTFRNNVGDKVTSDGLPFVDGKDGVQAEIRPDGKLFVLPNQAGTGSRKLTIDLSDEWTEGELTCLKEGCLWKANASVVNPVRPIVQISLTVEDICGVETALTDGLFALEVGETRCARMGYWIDVPAILDSGLNWVVRFRPGIWPDTSDVIVTRNTADLWTVTVANPAGTPCPDFEDCSVLVRTKRAKGKPGTVVEGFFRTPFLFSLQKK